MRQRPKALYFVIISFVAVACSFPFQAAWLYGHGLTELPQILSKISTHNFVVITCLLLNIPFLLRGSRALYFTLPATFIAVAVNNYHVYQWGQDFHTNVLLVSTFVFTSLFLPILHPHVIAILKEPQLRWWLQSVRKPVCLPIQVEPVRGRNFSTSTFDLSTTGAFISCETLKHLNPGDSIYLKFALHSLKRIQCHARVVRQASSSGQYPNGIGVEFVDLDRMEKRALNQFIHTLPERHSTLPMSSI